MNFCGKTIGLIIKERRIERGIKQFELAKKIGVSRTYLSDIENNRYLPGAKLLSKINEELHFIFLIKNDGNTIRFKGGEHYSN
ncbi:hypothetical protein AEA09_01525 [Lysinibacillus contaminans]|uniref:HTH cro/C1-type domain-containing protein n=1 Tax=Lysinibacillus contaminans TaxID=1293441 RepID=A0ABR5K5X6_9BACI|nr:helix-turn-helix transcriptional regulator [Lysinibacillus contaminans]KOS71695.1 hypothetical protein AEA09_01525 [Lysinibacillus contaminans]